MEICKMSDTPGPGEYQPDPAEPSDPAVPSGPVDPTGQAGPASPAGPSGWADPSGWAEPSAPGTPFGQQAGFGQGTPYGQPWAPAASYPQPADDAAPVIMSFGPALPQNRLTVFFRIFMVIPAVFVVGIIGIAAYFVGIVSWWAALFLGRLPNWAFEFQSGFLRWAARVQAYTYLLTDRYPPFTLEDADYPVRVFTRPTSLSRLAVLFRVILIIPAYLLAIISGFGLALLSIGAWVAALFTGQVPDSLHQALAAFIRYYTRFLGYWLLVTPEYPGGLYGDKVAAAPATEWTTPAAADAAAPDATAPDAGSGDTAPIAATTAAPATAGPWQLILSGSARNLVTVGLVLGVIGLGGDVAVDAVVIGHAGNTVNRAVADQTVTDDYNKLGTVITSFQTKTQDCQQNISCVTALDGQVAKAFQTFGTGLAGAGVPSDFSADAATLTADNTKVVGDFNQLATAQSAGQYTNIATGLNLQGDLTAWQSAFDKLHGELGRP
jgi:Domain of unknown function (DUF4389)